jgi:hypothetical protein
VELARQAPMLGHERSPALGAFGVDADDLETPGAQARSDDADRRGKGDQAPPPEVPARCRPSRSRQHRGSKTGAGGRLWQRADGLCQLLGLLRPAVHIGREVHGATPFQ